LCEKNHHSDHWDDYSVTVHRMKTKVLKIFPILKNTASEGKEEAV